MTGPKVNLSFKVLGIALALLVLYDIWAVNVLGYSETISWTMFEWSKKYPIIPFAWGILCGHLFWNVAIDSGIPEDKDGKNG